MFPVNGSIFIGNEECEEKIKEKEPSLKFLEMMDNCLIQIYAGVVSSRIPWKKIHLCAVKTEDQKQ